MNTITENNWKSKSRKALDLTHSVQMQTQWRGVRMLPMLRLTWNQWREWRRKKTRVWTLHACACSASLLWHDAV